MNLDLEQIIKNLEKAAWRNYLKKNKKPEDTVWGEDDQAECQLALAIQDAAKGISSLHSSNIRDAVDRLGSSITAAICSRARSMGKTPADIEEIAEDVNQTIDNLVYKHLR